MSIFPSADVFIDSNIVIKNCYDFHSGDLERLRHYAELGIIRLLTSEVVVSEVESNLKQDIALYASELRKFIIKRKPINELRFLDERHKFLFEDFRKLGWDDFILTQWHAYLKNTECQIIPIGTVTSAEILSDYFNLKPPFENSKLKKSEFPDAIIIKSLIEYTKDSFVTTFVLTDDKGWIKAFPDESITPWGDSSRKFIVVDNINTILKYIYGIETEQTKFANLVLSDIASINSVIERQVKYDIEDMTALVEFNNSYIINLDVDYDEIEEVIVDEIVPTFSSFEEIKDDYVTAIFDLELTIRITFFITDYENSVYDSEDKVYLYLKQGSITQIHYCETSISVDLEKHKDEHYYISKIKYPYEISVSDDTYIYEEESEDADDDAFDLYEADDESLILNMHEPDDDSLEVNLYESDDDSLNTNLYEIDDCE